MAYRWIACGLLTVLSACASSPVSRNACAPIRVMTWNIAAGHGDLGKVAETIRQLNPDVAALQEVDVRWSERSSFVDQPDSLGKLLGMHVRFAPIYDFRPRQFGVAVLSRHRIVSWKNHEITRLSTQQANPVPAMAPGFLETVLDIRGEKIRMFSTHLDYRSDPSVRAKQVAEMMDVISRSGMPTILAGDLNATPSASELRPLMSLFRISGSEMTYPADTPTKQIDYVLASSAFTISESRVYPTDASDHRPVVTTISPCSVRF